MTYGAVGPVCAILGVELRVASRELSATKRNRDGARVDLSPRYSTEEEMSTTDCWDVGEYDSEEVVGRCCACGYRSRHAFGHWINSDCRCTLETNHWNQSSSLKQALTLKWNEPDSSPSRLGQGGIRSTWSVGAVGFWENCRLDRTYSDHSVSLLSDKRNRHIQGYRLEN
ncbi:hypothetical protein J6590_000989 [Homalodisca vitripennis]|nr:hypothetical protein J6590_000989 [Homalodisca vitripennis]